ncbi:hypothetical protein ABH922_001100 [Rhodococcus sp. 27YEA15]
MFGVGLGCSRPRRCPAGSGDDCRGALDVPLHAGADRKRGMSKREDWPELDVAQRHHILTGGLGSVWTATAGVTGSVPVPS